MTPKEQDKELRDLLITLFESGKELTDMYSKYDGDKDWSDWLSEILPKTDLYQLITADRKRVALEAELQLLTYLLDGRTEHMFMQNPDTGEITDNGWLCNTSLSAVSANRIEAERRKRITKLKAQLEGL